MDWSDLDVLVTGGTGSFGRAFLRHALAHLQTRRLIVFSRDELKQHEMRVGGFTDPRLRFFIGDVRDVSRLRRAMQGVDVVVHAAALKQVPACEYNPMEAVRTNVDGARNVIDAALDAGVTRVMALSTDKAVNPVNLYGATKLVAEKLFVQANAYRGEGAIRLSCVRYGNVVGSRGSVVPLFIEQRRQGRVTVTDPRMTRFWITLDQAVRFVVAAIERMRGGEIFVPKIPSTGIMDLVEALAPDCEVTETGIRPGEKLHEVLLSREESRHAREAEDMYVIQPAHPWWRQEGEPHGEPVTPDFHYSSDDNPHSLGSAELRRLLPEVD